MRFETAPGEQAQVDWGSLGYVGADGRKHRIWVFVMTMAGQPDLKIYDSLLTADPAVAGAYR